MKYRFRNTWEGFTRWLTIRKLLVVGILLVLGVWYAVEAFQWADISANAFTELLGILVTVLVIDTLNERRAKRELRAQLIREIGSLDNGIALRATRELQAFSQPGKVSVQEAWLPRANLQRAGLREWDLQRVNFREADLSEADLFQANLSETGLMDANLEKASLIGADLSKARMFNANLRGALLSYASLRDAHLGNADLFETILDKGDLTGAKVKDEQLARAGLLKGAAMPDGSRYDGRFKLPREVWKADRDYIRITDSEALADFYGVSLEAYQFGDQWARENLPQIPSASLIGLDLREAGDLSEEFLAQAGALWLATMPDGNRYDGRYNLKWDVEILKLNHGERLTPQLIADFYDVPIGKYQTGQEWARQNLPKLLGEP